MPDSRVLRNHKGDSNMAESKQLLKAAYEYYLFGLVEDISLPKSAFGWKPRKHGACDSLAGSSSIRVRFCLLEKARCKWEPPWDHRRANTIMPFQLNPDTAKSEQLCDLTRGEHKHPSAQRCFQTVYPSSHFRTQEGSGEHGTKHRSVSRNESKLSISFERPDFQ